MEKIVIEIDRLALRACHGVMEQERLVGNDFEVSLRVVYPAAAAVESDCLDATLNYAEAVDVVRGVMAEPSALLENVCGRIRRELVARFPAIESGMVRVVKLHPPIAGVKIAGVAVELSW